MGAFDELKRRVTGTREALSGLVSDETGDPNPRSYSRRPSGLHSRGYETDLPDSRKIKRYRKMYRGFPIIRNAINGFSREIIEAGWYVVADDPRTQEALTEWLQNCAMVDGEVDEDFSVLVKRLSVERAISGTALTEIVKDEKGFTTSLKPIPSHTVKLYTKNGSSILLGPDDEHRTRDGVPRTPNGDTAAYVQYDSTISGYSDKSPRAFSRDEVVKVLRDPPTGEARGVPLLEAIAGRVEGLIQKLEDNDAAIASKAFPLILFQLGTEDDPYSEEEKKEFIEHYKNENFEPGLMQAVGGDVSIESFSGEVAEIQDAINYDVNHIVTGLPAPKYRLGAFDKSIGQSIAAAQERQHKKLVREVRREYENKFNPILEQVCEEHDFLDPEGVQLHIGRPSGEVAPEDVNGNIIKYDGVGGRSQKQGDGQADGGPGKEGEDQPPGEKHGPDFDGDGDGDKYDWPGSSPEETPGNDNDPSVPVEENSVFSVEIGDELEETVEELADPRFVSTRRKEEKLRTILGSVLVDARENYLEDFEDRFGDATGPGLSAADGVARRSLNRTMQEARIREQVSDLVEDTVQATVTTVNQQYHKPRLDTDFGIRNERQVTATKSALVGDTRDAIEDLYEMMNNRLREVANNSGGFEEFKNAVQNEFSDSSLKYRGKIIGQMNLADAVESTKLVEYEASPKVDGVRIRNPCDGGTTAICKELSGCGDNESPEAFFDNDQDIATQLAESTESEPPEGFRPLTAVPPFHFGCRSTIVPVVRE